jgi:DNA-binding Xre family transcriptional regulator
MKERGMTKKELISKSGINYEEFGLMEKNADLTLSAIRKVCLALNVDYKNVISLVYPSK